MGKTINHYITNLRGDVIGIVSEAGQLVVSYEYDAWGNILEISGSMATTLGTLNPLTYRGYVYDHETGLYYLQSRYYNLEWGRFLNMDSQINSDTGILGTNVFAYCLNNPVVSIDADGYSPNDVFDSVDEAAIDAALYMEELGAFENAWEYAANGTLKVYNPASNEVSVVYSNLPKDPNMP